MKAIDMASWPRRQHFEFFSKVSQPFYSLTFTLDVTALYDHAKARGLSFYYSLVYLCTKAINSVEAFRYSVVQGRPVLIDSRMPSFTDLRPGSELFYIVTLPMEDSLPAFCAAAAEKSRAQTELISPAPENEGLIFFSCLPWLELTALTHERDFDRDDSVPRVAWGKYHEENGRKKLGLSLELNHRFTDGIHVAMFARELERLISLLG